MNHFKIMLTMGILTTLSTLFGCGQNANNASSYSTDTSKDKGAVRKPITKPVENIVPTEDQKERRLQSEAYCTAHGIPFYKNPNSLFVDAEAQVTIRTQDEVLDRALALCYIGLKSEDLEQKHLDEMDKTYDIKSKLSPEEKNYVDAKHPEEQQKINANWRYEGLHVMLWALGYIDSLSYPDHMCDVARDVKIMHSLGPEAFRKNAKLRSKKEILDQADLILRLNWACVNARINNQSAPGKMDKGVVFERHHALNWLIRYMNEEWDEVTTDT